MVRSNFCRWKTKTEIPHDVLITAFDVKRIIAHNLSVKYNLIDANGINDKALQSFFETARESLSDKYGKIVAASKFEADEQKEKYSKLKASTIHKFKMINQLHFILMEN